MKNYGYTSNSNLSSFTIPLRMLTEEQVYKIYNHIEESTNHMNYYDFDDISDDDAWEITEDDNYIEGSSYTESFDMRTYLIDYLNIHENIIKWG
jgi:hypothetical protein